MGVDDMDGTFLSFAHACPAFVMRQLSYSTHSRMPANGPNLREVTLLGLPHGHAHGTLRAPSANILRGRGLSDAEIALRIGHKTGGQLIVDVYGEGLEH
jgi:hypothetical protein